MKIQIASDLHLDYNVSHGGLREMPLEVVARTLVMAGDLSEEACLERGLRDLHELYEHVIYVPGNHDFYGSSFRETRETLARAQRDYESIHVLDNQRKKIGDRWFVGSTLWFRDDPENYKYASNLSDFHVIRDFVPAVYEENAKAIEFLARSIQCNDIVVTHHMPHPRCVTPFFRGNVLNRFFLCDVSDIIENNKPKLWVTAHTHSYLDFRVGATRIICNPFGYLNVGEVNNYNRKMVITV